MVNGICFSDEKEAHKSKRVTELYERCMREAEKSTKQLDIRSFKHSYIAAACVFIARVSSGFL
jgi:hypothetical protein